ncbi:MAG: Putative S-layer protein [Thermoanaerobacterales bacterium 50_218]|nr:MAG: Putative S-layer protein [Thermoanaerobacterales bacterium 50_218]HAA89295.1 hypothetical protein [Peptococcaceae bacterium]
MVFRKKWFLSLVALVVALCMGGSVALALPPWKGGPNSVFQVPGKGREIGHRWKFADIGKHWGKEVITEASVQGLVYGYPDATFQPNKPVTHLEALVMLANAFQRSQQVREEVQARTELHQRLRLWLRQKGKEWALEPLVVAVSQGLITEEELFSFHPNQPCKRWEIAKYLGRALGLQEQVRTEERLRQHFRDAKDIPQAVAGIIEYLFQKGLMVGTPDGFFLPQKPVTRAEMAALLLKLQEILKELREDIREVVDRYYVVGTIEAISGNEITIEKRDGTVVTVEVADDTYLFARGERVDLDGLKVGDWVKVIAHEGTAVFIKAVQVQPHL